MIRPRRLARPPVLALVLAALPAAAQQELWTKQAPIPTGSSVASLAAVSQVEVWGVAGTLPSGQGSLVHSADAGASWETVALDTNALAAVFFTDAQHGWAAGNGFFHTTDGGQTWIRDNTWGTIHDLFFLDTQTGWAGGNGSVTYRTSDGGLSWTAVQAPGGYTVLSIQFLDALNGWAVNGGGQIIRSTDGGQSWTMVADFDTFLASIQFFDALNGWAIGGNTFLHTTDGGQSWTPAAVPPGTWVYDAHFASAQRGLAVGDAGSVLVTQDGGQTWLPTPSGAVAGLGSVAFADAGTAFFAGGWGTLARSGDGGLSWSSIQSGGTGFTRALDALDDERAWAASSDGALLHTVDGGQLWERSFVAGFGPQGKIEDVDFVDAATGWAVGGEGTHERIARSVDGGSSWQLQHDASGGTLRGVAAVDPLTAYAVGVGAQETVLRTLDGGQTWVGVSPKKGVYSGACFLDRTNGWVVGSHIYRTQTGGKSWTLQHTAGGPQLAAVSFADAERGWAVGYQGLLLRTLDGGATWKQQSAGAPAGTALMDVDATGPDAAWVAGWNGFAARTQDGGKTWQPETVPGAGGASFAAVRFVDGEVGWVGGAAGIWRRGAIEKPLAASPKQLSLGAGGAQSFTLEAGSEHAGDVYALLGTSSGTEPGFPVDGVVVPLNTDGWFALSILLANAPPFAGNIGVLDASGAATAALVVPPGAPAGLLGVTLHHAYVVLDVSKLGFATFVSNPVSLALLP